MDKVNVYILTSDPNNQRVKYLNNLFTSDLFKLRTINIENPATIDLSNLNDFNKDSANEYYKLQVILKHSARDDPQNPILFLKDNLISNADSVTIENIIREVMKRSWDIFYLSKWLDDCQSYERNDIIHENGTIYTKSTSPNGVDAVLIRPTLRDILIGEKHFQDDTPLKISMNVSHSLQSAIAEKKIVASTLSPNLFHIDVSTINQGDSYRMNECKGDPKNIQQDYNINREDINKFFQSLTSGKQSKVILAVILIIILIIALYYLYRK